MPISDPGDRSFYPQHTPHERYLQSTAVSESLLKEIISQTDSYLVCFQKQNQAG